MSPLLSTQDITKSFGSKELFKEISFSVFTGEKIGIVGPNGSGKSTFLKILSDEVTADDGIISKKKNLIVGYVPQASISPPKMIMDYLLEVNPNEYEIQSLLSQFNFPAIDKLASELSGGWQKKLEIVRALLLHPDILLLDEPTNHLDLESIEWLEGFLSKNVSTYIVTSHDRRFLENTTNRILEINKAFPKGTFSVKGSWSEFLEKKEQFLQGQLEYKRSLSFKVRREEEWLRTSPKARTTKSRSRIGQAEELISELSKVKERTKEKKIGIEFSSTERETRKLLSAKNISKTLGEKTLFSKLDILLSPGTRLGLVGPNGCGKSTLLKILALEIPPDSGTIKTIEGLKIVYFDQMRAQIPAHYTIKQALHPHGDMVTFRGKPLHVNSWGKKFFFTPDKMELPVSQLSGGERARLMIAKLMLEPADILLLDEPTNDLDIDTLEVMEESFANFPGAIVLITHDRYLLDQVCRELIGLDLDGDDRYVSDFRQYESKKKKEVKAEKIVKEAPQKRNVQKFSYKEKFEYEKLEKDIAALEADIELLHSELEKPHDYQKLDELGKELLSKQDALETAFLRWHELDDKIRS